MRGNQVPNLRDNEKRRYTARARSRRRDKVLGAIARVLTEDGVHCRFSPGSPQDKSNTIFFTRGTANREWPTPREIFAKISPLLHIHCIINHVHRGQAGGEGIR